jgi:hypothetical protein
MTAWSCCRVHRQEVDPASACEAGDMQGLPAAGHHSSKGTVMPRGEFPGTFCANQCEDCI